MISIRTRFNEEVLQRTEVSLFGIVLSGEYLGYLFWSLYCISFFELRILVTLLASSNFLICNKTNGIRFTFLNPLSICNVCLEVITKTNLGQILEMFNDCYSCLSFTSVGFLFCICTLVLILLFLSLRIIRNLFIREKSNEILIWYRIVTIV